MNHKHHIFFLTLTVLVLMFSYAYFSDAQKKHTAIQSYADCVASGYPVIETYPQTCKIPGKTFSNNLQKLSGDTHQKNTASSSSASTILSPTNLQKENYKNTRYTLEGTVVTLINGTGSAALLVGSDGLSSLSYFGNDVYFDANNDAINDVAFLIKAESEIGSSLYYLALALSVSTTSIQRGANALFLGENVSPQSLSYNNTILTFSYGEPKSKKQKTTTMKSKQFTVRDNLLHEK